MGGDIIPIMILTLAEVEHISELARLDLTAAEKELYRQQLSDILEYAARLQAVNTEQVLPTASVLPPRTVLRPDLVTESLDRTVILQNAPLVEDHQFRVPPVLE